MQIINIGKTGGQQNYWFGVPPPQSGPNDLPGCLNFQYFLHWEPENQYKSFTSLFFIK